MEILKKIKKRFCPLVLAVVIFTTSVASGPMSLTARAASVTVDAEFSTELAMLLYNIMETVAISSGIKNGLDDYESGSTLYDAFVSYLDSAATPPYLRDTYITLADGSSMTIQDAIEAANATAGNNALKLPEEEVFAKYRTISGGKNPESSPEPSPSPTPSGDDDYVVLDKFHEIAFILVSSPMLAMCTKFFEVVLQGDVEGVDPAEYYDQGELFTGYPTESNAGKVYVYESFNYGGSSTLSKVELNYNALSDDYYYFFMSYGSNAAGAYMLKPGRYNLKNGTYSFPDYAGLTDDVGNAYKFDYFYYPNGSSTGEKNYKNFSIVSTFPIFTNFKAYCEGKLSALLYAPDNLPYDYHSMTAAAPDTLERLPGTKLDPNNIPALNNAMKEAANGVEATDTDKDANNAKMIAAVKAAVAEALAEAQPDPSPTSAPDPEPSAAPEPGTDTDYTGILGLILAAINAIASSVWDFFSNPMGIITNGITSILELFPQVNTLIQALPAAVFGFFRDPLGAITSGISNLYNGVLRIIEIFPEQVQLVLGNIASLPDALLQVFADPLGAIQSLLGLLPSWANLQSYLDKILQALLDPVSALQPSDPGGTDPGGDGSESGKHTPDLLSLLNGLILLIMILLMLLRIFLHCLQFIVGIFKIQATPGFLPDEMVMGLDYLKTLEITGIGMSVYDFMMGLVYIFMVFGVVKLLRGFAFHIHIPKGGR